MKEGAFETDKRSDSHVRSFAPSRDAVVPQAKPLACGNLVSSVRYDQAAEHWAGSYSGDGYSACKPFEVYGKDNRPKQARVPPSCAPPPSRACTRATRATALCRLRLSASRRDLRFALFSLSPHPSVAGA